MKNENFESLLQQKIEQSKAPKSFSEGVDRALERLPMARKSRWKIPSAAAACAAFVFIGAHIAISPPVDQRAAQPDSPGYASTGRTQYEPQNPRQPIDVEMLLRDQLSFITNLDELSAKSDAILEVEPTDPFQERPYKVSFLPNGSPSDIYTIASVKTLRAIKFDGKAPEALAIREPFGIPDINGKKKGQFTKGSYLPMEKGMTYIVFLKKTDDGQFEIFNYCDGKFNTDGKDAKDSYEGLHSNKKVLKNEVLQRYGSK